MLKENSQCEFEMKGGLRDRSETCSSTDSLLGSDDSTRNSNRKAEDPISDLDETDVEPGGSDSDILNGGKSAVVPTQLDEAKKQKIISLAEFYFSDEQLLKDVFLLKHVKRNKEGYVSLKLLSSFKKMKSATKDWNEVAFALKESGKFELNEVGTKVRRRQPLPDYDETTPSRVVIAFNLPFEKPTVADLMPIFSRAGDIVSIRIVNPGNIPTEVKKYKIKHQALGSSVCVIVEYDTYKTAAKSAEILCANVDGNWRQMTVVHVATSTPEPTSPMKAQTDSTQKRKRARHKNRSFDDASDYLTGYSTSPSLSNSDIDQPLNHGKDSAPKKRSGRRRSSVKHVKSNSYSENRFSSYNGEHFINGLQKKLGPKDPEERRYSEGNVLGDAFPRDRRRACSFCIPVKSAVQILRNPLGPDGTIGFKNAATRPCLPTFTEISAC